MQEITCFIMDNLLG